jgi:hypothetical protein
MINPYNIQADLTHEGEVGLHLFGPAEVIPFGVRLKGTVRDAFNEKLLVTFQEEFRRRANSRVLGCCHVERSRDISRCLRGFNQEIPRLRSE